MIIKRDSACRVFGTVPSPYIAGILIAIAIYYCYSTPSKRPFSLSMATECGSLPDKPYLSFRVCSKAHKGRTGQRAQSSGFIYTNRRKYYQLETKNDLVGICAML